MNYLLVYPEPTDNSPAVNTPLSILYVGEWLKERGINVRYVDLRTEKLLEHDIDWADKIGFSAMTGKQCYETSVLAEKIKSVYPEKITAIGGFHPKSTTIIDPNIDEVCKTDYVPERFPFNESTKRYFMPPYVPQYFSSNGCWGNCTFCCLRAKWRGTDINEVKYDLDRILWETGQKFVFFGEPNIGASYKRIEGIGEIFKKHRAGWHANIRPDVLSSKMVHTLADSNCKSLEIGAESGNDYALEHLIKKDTTREIVLDVARRLSETDISCMYSFITNFPGETKQMQNDTCDLIDEIHAIDKNARTSIFSYMAMPGTEMYDTLIREGKFKPPERLRDWGKINMSGDPIYWIAGLTFRKDNTAKNFPGQDREIIRSYEELAERLWTERKFDEFPCREVEELIFNQRKKQ